MVTGGLLLQAFEQFQFGLEIDVMGKFEVRNKTRRLDVIRMRQHELFVLRRSCDRFIVFGCLVALVNKITSGKAIKKKEFSCADCPVASVCGQSKLACEKGEC